MRKTVLAASAMLLALCSAAVARDAKLHPHTPSEAAVGLSEVHPNSFGFAAPMKDAGFTEDAGSDAHRYHGGPKSND